MQDQPCTTQLLSRVISHTQPHLYLLHSGEMVFGGNDFRGKWSSGEMIYYPRLMDAGFLIIKSFSVVHKLQALDPGLYDWHLVKIFQFMV